MAEAVSDVTRTYYIGIDAATKTGWAAINAAGEYLAGGVWDCTVRPGEGAGMRWVRARRYAQQLVASFDPDALIVAFERVVVSGGTKRQGQTDQVYSGVMSQVQVVLEESGWDTYHGINVGQLKKWATGNGGCGKPEMIAAAKAMYPDVEIEDDNHADAILLAAAARDGVCA